MAGTLTLVSSRLVRRRYHLRGEVAADGRRPTLVLPPQTPGFINRSAPKYLVHFSHADPANGDKPGRIQPNIDMNQVWQGINVDLTSGAFFSCTPLL